MHASDGVSSKGVDHQPPSNKVGLAASTPTILRLLWMRHEPAALAPNARRAAIATSCLVLPASLTTQSGADKEQSPQT